MLNLLGQFHFIRPEWLLALLPVVLILIGLRLEKKSQGDWQSLIPAHLLKHLLHEQQGSSSKVALCLLGGIWLLTILALAGPTWEKIEQPVYQKIQASVYILDLSYSMYSADLKPNRITRARLKLIDLLKHKREGLSALVVFSGAAHVVTPLTNDVNTIISLIPALDPGIMPNVGSNAKQAVRKALELLSNTQVENGEIILLTDEVLVNDRQNINAMMEKSNYRLSILGIGTPEGAPIKLPNGQFLKDNNDAIVIPKLNQTELKNLAEDNKGLFVKIRQDDKDILYIHSKKALDDGQEARESQQNFDIWFEAGQYLLLPILFLAALAFRKGWLLGLLICCSLSPLPNKSYASEEEALKTKEQESILFTLNEHWHNLWLTGDQRGINSLKEQKFSDAAKQFSNPNWKATALFYNGQFDQAAEAFKVNSNDSSEQQAISWYNKGNALARSGQLSQAIKAYDQSLSLREEDPDTIFNRALVEELKNNPPPQSQQEQQEQQEKGDQGEEGNKQDQEQGQDSDSNSDQSSPADQEQQSSSDSSSNKQEDPDPQASDQEPNEQQDQQTENSESDNTDPESTDSESSEAKNTDAEDSEEQEAKSAEDGETEDDQETSSNNSQDDNPKSEKEDNEENLSGSKQSPLDREKQEALEQWLRQVPDDPSGLMRRKFDLEYKRRTNDNSESQQVW